MEGPGALTSVTGRPGPAAASAMGHTGAGVPGAPLSARTSPGAPLAAPPAGAVRGRGGRATGRLPRAPRHQRSLAEHGVFLLTCWPPGPCGVGPERRTDTPVGKDAGSGPPAPSLLDGPSTMLRPRQGDSPLRAACICPLCEAVGAAELTPRCRVLQFFYSASPASPQPPGT